MLKRDFIAATFFTIFSVIILFSALLIQPFGESEKTQTNEQSLISIIFEQRYFDVIIGLIVLVSAFIGILFLMNGALTNQFPCSLGSLRNIKNEEEDKK